MTLYLVVIHDTRIDDMYKLFVDKDDSIDFALAEAQVLAEGRMEHYDESFRDDAIFLVVACSGEGDKVMAVEIDNVEEIVPPLLGGEVS